MKISEAVEKRELALMNLCIQIHNVVKSGTEEGGFVMDNWVKNLLRDITIIERDTFNSTIEGIAKSMIHHIGDQDSESFDDLEGLAWRYAEKRKGEKGMTPESLAELRMDFYNDIEHTYFFVDAVRRHTNIGKLKILKS